MRRFAFSSESCFHQRSKKRVRFPTSVVRFSIFDMNAWISGSRVSALKASCP